MNEPELFARMRSLDETERTSYAEKGRICLTVKNTLLHFSREDPETGQPCSLSAWIRLAAPWSYATCFAAMRDCQELSDVPVEQLAKVPATNFAILRQLSTAVRAQPEVIQAAQTKRPDEFIEQIKRDHPSQHIESRRTLRFLASESEAEEIEEALRQAMERGAMNRTEALVVLAVNYRADVLMEELQKEGT